MSVLSRNERVLFLGAGVLLCVEVLLLLMQMRLVPWNLPWSSARNSPGVIGQIISKSQTVKDRSSESLSWYPLAEGDSIHVDDLVMTGSDSSARIKMEGEGELVLGPDTLISFQVDRSNPKRSLLQLEVGQGAVTVRSQSAPVRVKVKNQTLQIQPSSEVVLSKEAVAQDSKVLVSKGNLEVESEEKTLAVQAGEAVKLSVTPMEDTAVVAPEPETRVIATKLDMDLSSILELPRPGEKILAKNETLKQEFTWSGGDADFLEVDEASDFSNSTKTEVQGERAIVDLAPGHYFWRLGKGEARSKISDFIVMPGIHYKALSPSPYARFKLGEKVAVKWKPVDKASRYRFQLSRSSDFSDILKEESVEKNEISFEDLEVGQYFWRLQAEHESLGEWPVSETYSFQVKKPLEAPKPKRAVPLKKSEGFSSRLFASLLDFLVPAAVAAEGELPSVEVLIEWEPTRRAKSYILEIATDRAFKKVLSRKEVVDTEASLVLPPFEKYYWRVAGRDSDGDQGPFSSPEELLYSTLVPPPPPRPKPEPVREVAAVPTLPSSTSQNTFAQSLAIGFGGKLLNQSVKASDTETKVSGTLLGTTSLEWQGRFPNSAVSVSGWYEPRKFESKDGLPGDIQTSTFYRKEWGADFIYHFNLGRWQWLSGFRVENSSVFYRLTGESVSLEQKALVSLLAGFLHSWGSTPYYRVRALLEGTGLGGAKGIGMDARGIVGFPKALGFLTPEVFFGFHPTFLTFDLQNQSRATVNVSLGASLGTEW